MNEQPIPATEPIFVAPTGAKGARGYRLDGLFFTPVREYNLRSQPCVVKSTHAIYGRG